MGMDDVNPYAVGGRAPAAEVLRPRNAAWYLWRAAGLLFAYLFILPPLLILIAKLVGNWALYPLMGNFILADYCFPYAIYLMMALAIISPENLPRC